MVQAASRPSSATIANGVMAAAKRAGLNPREVAAEVINRFQSDSAFADIVVAMDVAGPGFINLTLSPQFVAPY